MIEVYKNLFVGSESDVVLAQPLTEWFIIHACKEPYHRQALGYSGRAASQDHPEYLIAKRDGRLILNLVDVKDPAYIPKEIIDVAVESIHQNIPDKKVLVHCNQGMSRSPTIALLYLKKYTNLFDRLNRQEAIEYFRRLYGPFSPADGVSGFTERYWDDFS